MQNKAIRGSEGFCSKGTRCKGNLAVLRKSLKLARDDPKRIYKNNIYKQGMDTTDLARDDPKRIL